MVVDIFLRDIVRLMMDIHYVNICAAKDASKDEFTLDFMEIQAPSVPHSDGEVR